MNLKNREVKDFGKQGISLSGNPVILFTME